MNQDYQVLTRQTADTLQVWLSGLGAMECYVLFDAQRLSEAQLQSVDRGDWGVARNLYADLTGTGIAALGPRLVRLDEDHRQVAAQWALTTQAVGFLAGTVQINTLVEHLQAIREVELPAQSAALFRYQDVNVMAALLPVLSASNRQRCLGPLQRWAVVDACANLHSISMNRGTWAQAPLRFDAHTVNVLEERLFTYTVIAQANDVDSTLLAKLNPCQTETLIRQRIQAARLHGLSQKEDLALYCVLSLQFPPGFEKHPPFAKALRYRENRYLSFGEALDHVPSAQWEAWDKRLEKNR